MGFALRSLFARGTSVHRPSKTISARDKLNFYLILRIYKSVIGNNRIRDSNFLRKEP
jgi:hypothetical protein